MSGRDHSDKPAATGHHEHHGHHSHDHGSHRDHHDHDHDHPHGSHYSDIEARVMALETILTAKGYVDPAAIDAIVERYEDHVGPHIGAGIVAKAWTDPDFAAALRQDATAAIDSLGLGGRQADHVVAVFNSDDTHNMVVCTLCSCYPWALLGLPPTWYKSAAYRARSVSEPRAVLREFGLDLPETTRVRVWDSTSEIRYLVIPQRPAGTEGWSQAELARQVSRDSMIGTALATPPGGAG